jgi:predicted nuclease of restriction endonuclease-like (RecB) superfamily
MPNIVSKNLESIYTNIKNVLDEARNKAIRSVNFTMVQAYWHIGRLIIEEEQNGKERANYGESLIEELSKRLTVDYGKGFNRTNLWYMRQFYLTFRNLHAVRGDLTWTYYRLLLKVENENARDFYMIESVNSNWSTR